MVKQIYRALEISLLPHCIGWWTHGITYFYNFKESTFIIISKLLHVNQSVFVCLYLCMYLCSILIFSSMYSAFFSNTIFPDTNIFLYLVFQQVVYFLMIFYYFSHMPSSPPINYISWTNFSPTVHKFILSEEGGHKISNQ